MIRPCLAVVLLAVLPFVSCGGSPAAQPDGSAGFPDMAAGTGQDLAARAGGDLASVAGADLAVVPTMDLAHVPIQDLAAPPDADTACKEVFDAVQQYIAQHAACKIDADCAEMSTRCGLPGICGAYIQKTAVGGLDALDQMWDANGCKGPCPPCVAPRPAGCNNGMCAGQ